MIVCGILTDGRPELLEDTLTSAREHLRGVDFWYVVNDSADTDFSTYVKKLAPDMHHVTHPQRLGLAGAVQSVWETALGTDCRFLFHLEGDFQILELVDLTELAGFLDARPHLAQVVLKRQPLTPVEGDNVILDHWIGLDGWVQQSDVFSLNPCLIPRRILEYGWPSGPLGVGNESGMTARLQEEGFSFAFWGDRDDPPRVHHLGTYRTAGWSL